MNKSRNKKAGYNSYQPEEIYLKNLSDPRRPIGLIALFTLCYFSFFLFFLCELVALIVCCVVKVNDGVLRGFFWNIEKL